MTTMDFGLFSLDLLAGKGEGEESGGGGGGLMDLIGGCNTPTSHQQFDLQLPKDELQDILNMSLQENGIGEEVVVMEPSSSDSSNCSEDINMPSWDDETDEFLKSMLTGSDLSPESQLGFGCSEAVLSDTSSDSGVGVGSSSSGGGTEVDVAFNGGGVDGGGLQQRTLTSPGLDDGPCPTVRPSRMLMSPGLDSPQPYSPAHSVDLIDYLSNDSDNGDSISPLDITMDPMITTATGTTTIILPAIRPTTNSTASTTAAAAATVPAQQVTLGQPHTVTVTSHRLIPRDQAPATKRRRVSASSSDSGVEDNKYPKVELNDEERKMAIKEGMTFPKYYPLTREEERNLKKIRRKIRNKLSAQDSRKRKREYLDNMEDRVKACTDENDELKDKIKALETQNKTLAAQLRRLHQIVVNGGLRQGQTSTALMVLLLSTALFLIPGVRDQTESKSEIDIQAAVKMPPMPGQSRSLLQFNGIERNTDIADLTDFQEDVKSEPGTPDSIEERGGGGGEGGMSPLHTDHDYTTAIYQQQQNTVKTEPGKAWIHQDAPPLGYGSAMKPEDETRHLNVSVASSGQGTRTVVLQIPKDIK